MPKFIPMSAKDEKAYASYATKLGARLQGFRTGLKMSKVELAKKFGVSGVTVDNWERGEGISLRCLYRYSDLTKKPVSKLLERV